MLSPGVGSGEGRNPQAQRRGWRAGQQCSRDLPAAPPLLPPVLLRPTEDVPQRPRALGTRRQPLAAGSTPTPTRTPAPPSPRTAPLPARSASGCRVIAGGVSRDTPTPAQLVAPFLQGGAGTGLSFTGLCTSEFAWRLGVAAGGCEAGRGERWRLIPRAGLAGESFRKESVVMSWGSRNVVCSS